MTVETKSVRAKNGVRGRASFHQNTRQTIHDIVEAVDISYGTCQWILSGCGEKVVGSCTKTMYLPTVWIQVRQFLTKKVSDTHTPRTVLSGSSIMLLFMFPIQTKAASLCHHKGTQRIIVRGLKALTTADFEEYHLSWENSWQRCVVANGWTRLLCWPSYAEIGCC